MSEWRVEPADGYSPLDLLDRGPNEINARLVKYKYGIKYIDIPYDSYLARAVNAEMPTIRVEIKTPKKRVARVEELQPKRWLYSGSSPYRQLVIEYLLRMENANKLVTLNEVASYIARECKENEKAVRKLIRKMHDAGQVYFKGGHIFASHHSALLPKRERQVMEFVLGINPVMKYIYDFIESRGGITDYRSIRDRMFAIKWIRKERVLQSYLRRMIKNGYIRQVGDNMYECVRPPSVID